MSRPAHGGRRHGDLADQAPGPFGRSGRRWVFCTPAADWRVRRRPGVGRCASLVVAAVVMLTAIPDLADAVAAPSQPSVTKSSVASRMANVKRLLEKSSGARQIAERGNAEARAKHARARDLYAAADASFRKGDLGRANTLLGQATVTMFQAVRAVDASKMLKDKKRKDFENRAESIRALTGALERIGREKGRQMHTSQVTATVKRMTREARLLADRGDLAEGRRVLDAAYDTAKRSIEELRGGDTLVRSLNFETEEEEYAYEVDRNDTHRMLIKILLQEKRASVGVDRMVQTFLGRADTLRSEAEASASRGDYQTAIKSLENSTKEIVRAIRSAGIYIPG